jgi:prepilin-type N-terminal cleavage/methylation domain-containing protein/prepilin-type processing-associated H-X9-DG protein
MCRKLSDRTNGFTLVELLVVISIIALLLAVLMPALSKAREQGRKIVCGSTIRNFSLANQVYMNTYDGMCLPYTMYGVEYTAKYGGHGCLWFLNQQFITMMGLDKKEKNSNNLATEHKLSDKFKCPTDKRTVGNGYYKTSSEVIEISYGYNHTQKNSYSTSISMLGFKFSQIKTPGRKVAFMDGVDGGLYQACAEFRLYWDKYGDWAGSPNVWNAASYRHGEGANVGFFDGHGEYRKKQDVFKVDSLGRSNRVENMKIWQPLEDVGLF